MWNHEFCIIFIGVVISNIFVVSASGNSHAESNSYAISEKQKTEANEQPYYELPCLAIGGLCLKVSDCPDGKATPMKGLCPRQQRNHVECCYGVSRNDKRCRANGGECFPSNFRCPDNMKFQRATDCSPNQTCCILVN